MLEPEPIEYEDALLFAEDNQHKLVAAIPSSLAEKEDRFLQKMRRSRLGALKKLEVLYLLMDELSEATLPFTPCKNQCSACCHYGVTISPTEIAYIEKNTKYRRLKNPTENRQFHGIPCPFLKQGSCSIYRARPFVCRRHNALTHNSYWCHHERSDRSFPKVGFTNINQVFDDIRLETNACGVPYDIRQYFGQ